MCLWCDVCACDLKVDALQSLDSYLPERLANALLKQSRKSIRNILIFISDWGKIASFQYKKNNVILIDDSDGYGSTSCQVSSPWIKNPKDFCLKLRIFKGLIDKSFGNGI